MFTADERRILTWSLGGTTRLWTADGDSLAVIKHDELVYGAAFTADERRILTWSDDGTARLWTLDGDSLAVMQHDDEVDGAVFTASRILTWSLDERGNGTGRLWTADGDSLAVIDGVLGGVFTADESRLLTWGVDAQLWNAADGSPRALPMQHDERVYGAAFTADESRILTWSRDGTARLWTADGDSLAVMQHDEVNGAAFTADESRILTWSNDGTARLWDVPGDLDFPSKSFPLQVVALTGIKLNHTTRELESLEPQGWLEESRRYWELARRHYKTCKYPRQNLFRRFFPDEAKSIRPDG